MDRTKILAQHEAGGFRITLYGEEGPFKAAFTSRKDEQGAILISIKLSAEKEISPPPLILGWEHPAVGAHLLWHPGVHADRTIPPEWRPAMARCNNTTNMPVLSLFSASGRNAMTFAFSEVIHASTLTAGFVEEKAGIRCSIELFREPVVPFKEFVGILRIDARPITWFRAIADVGAWWEAMTQYKPASIPVHALLPVYSTWYSFHQELSEGELEEQSRLAKDCGFETLIVDDGWQTDDVSRGYAFCGDWEVDPAKFPDFTSHVNRIHNLGFKYLLWVSLPFIGIHAKAYPRLKDKVLRRDGDNEWFILDPRFPEVREYLISRLLKLASSYPIDGFKLDFIDTFQKEPLQIENLHEANTSAMGPDPGWDIQSLPAAIEELLHDIYSKLRNSNPDVLIEFRQSYIGPSMKKYANMLRAIDVPGDYHGNRIRTLDLRLLSGSTPVHSDMLMWNPADTVESAAMQFVHTLFSVPQVSMRLDELPPIHKQMVLFYIQFWRKHQQLLMEGTLEPLDPGNLYSAVRSYNDEQMIVAFYGRQLLQLNRGIAGNLVLMNGTFHDSLFLEISIPGGERKVIIYSCIGAEENRYLIDLNSGVHRFDIPPAGLAVIQNH
ncbi:MAG: alpha-galactosidase [Spirochaetales bacterium]|nr:alpha-galactosidase [Spirochaetales bacterium]